MKNNNINNIYLSSHNNKRKIAFLLIVIGLILVIISFCLSLFLKDSKPNNVEDKEEEKIDPLWVGTYVGTYNNKNYQVVLYPSSLDRYSLSIELLNDDNSSSFNVHFDYPEGKEITIHYDTFLDEYDVKITKTANGINLVSTSSNSDSVIYNLNMSLTKKSFNKKGWDGTYTMGNNTIILSEVDENKCVIIFINGDDQIEEYIDNTEAKIKFYLGENELIISKTGRGISVESNFLPNGEYLKN